ncbi:GNAT family N-acetyltransferase [Persicobacter psychrovividus]
MYQHIPVKTFYLEHSDCSTTLPALPADYQFSAWSPTVDEYLKIYQAVGAPFGWTGRILMKTTELRALLAADQHALYLLKYQDQVAGFVEYILHPDQAIEIVYFGLTPEFTGKGLGKVFLQTCIVQAYRKQAKKVWLHTCEFDHPNALPNYQKMGFRLLKEQIDQEPYLPSFLKEFKRKFPEITFTYEK